MSNHIDLDRLHARLIALTFDLGHQDLGEQVNALVAVVRTQIAREDAARVYAKSGAFGPGCALTAALKAAGEALAPFRAKEPRC